MTSADRCDRGKEIPPSVFRDALYLIHEPSQPVRADSDQFMDRDDGCVPPGPPDPIEEIGQLVNLISLISRVIGLPLADAPRRSPSHLQSNHPFYFPSPGETSGLSQDQPATGQTPNSGKAGRFRFFHSSGARREGDVEVVGDQTVLQRL